jgi:hypothetical protein
MPTPTMTLARVNEAVALYVAAALDYFDTTNVRGAVPTIGADRWYYAVYTAVLLSLSATAVDYSDY